MIGGPDLVPLREASLRFAFELNLDKLFFIRRD